MKEKNQFALWCLALTFQQHASVSQGRICLTSQQHDSVSQGRICLTSQQHASVSQGRICSDDYTCCHTETEAPDLTIHLTRPKYTDTGPTSPGTDPMTPGTWQGGHWSAKFLSQWNESTPEKSRHKQDSNLGSSALEADALTTRPTRRSRTPRSGVQVCVWGRGGEKGEGRGGKGRV